MGSNKKIAFGFKGKSIYLLLQLLFLTEEGERRWFFQDSYDFKRILLKHYKKIKEKFKKYIHIFRLP